MDQTLFFCHYGKRWEKTGEDGEVGKIGVAQFLGKSSSKSDVTHQFLCTVVSSAVFYRKVTLNRIPS
jgi:hypothetical protein